MHICKTNENIRPYSLLKVQCGRFSTIWWWESILQAMFPFITWYHLPLITLVTLIYSLSHFKATDPVNIFSVSPATEVLCFQADMLVCLLPLAENPFQSGAGASGRPRGALFVLQRHLSERRAHPRPQVLLRPQDRGHGQSMPFTIPSVELDRENFL